MLRNSACEAIHPHLPYTELTLSLPRYTVATSSRKSLTRRNNARNSAGLNSGVRLLAATGMWVSEELALQVADVAADGLLFRTTKFQKSRLLPMHDTVRIALGRHMQHRARTAPAGTSLFTSTRDRPPPITRWPAHSSGWSALWQSASHQFKPNSIYEVESVS